VTAVELLPPAGPIDVGIDLRDGLFAILDDGDEKLVTGYLWTPIRIKGLIYARASVGRGRILMHNLITGWGRCDHINGDGLDNRRINLREATKSQNGANRRKSVPGSASRFKGVSRHADGRQWRAQIGVNGEKVYLGLHPTEEAAARAYDDKARAVFGEFAALNFPRTGEASCLR
jgi:hypothetical protein